mmetsp:Transcript_44527/g.96881  ORF Transcript_44527/g.96881 Transcript_44527/m.96881 type:complete len:217 (+) Transcript_44527:944-1594(+)
MLVPKQKRSGTFMKEDSVSETSNAASAAPVRGAHPCQALARDRFPVKHSGAGISAVAAGKDRPQSPPQSMTITRSLATSRFFPATSIDCSFCGSSRYSRPMAGRLVMYRVPRPTTEAVTPLGIRQTSYAPEPTLALKVISKSTVDFLSLASSHCEIVVHRPSSTDKAAAAAMVASVQGHPVGIRATRATLKLESNWLPLTCSMKVSPEAPVNTWRS